MEKIEFQKIMDALTDHIKVCEQQFKDIKTTEDISRLTLARAADLKNFCVTEEKTMTNICMVDLYHIIGMGKLTPPQMMQFTYSIQGYLKYRPTIKALAKNLNSISELPKIPVETQYRLQGLGGLILKSGNGSPEVDEASVADYEKSKNVSILPFRIIGKQIKVDMTQFDYFLSLMTNLFKSNLSADNFKNKMRLGKEYLGIKWIGCTDTEATGNIISNDSFTHLSQYYNSRI